jgi:hypothetical protein
MTPALDRGRPKARPRPNQLSLPESPLHEIQAVRLLENGLWLVDRGRRFPKDVATLGCSGLGAFPGSPAPVGKGARRRYNDHARTSKSRPGRAMAQPREIRSPHWLISSAQASAWGRSRFRGRSGPGIALPDVSEVRPRGFGTDSDSPRAHSLSPRSKRRLGQEPEADHRLA